MSLITRFAGFFRKHLDNDLDAELRSHIEMRIERNLAAGMSPDDARRAARLRFGNPVALREETRRRDILPWLESFAQDLRYAWRNMRSTPLLAAVVVVSLALGIGANTAIFSVIDAVLLRMLPVRHPEQLQLLTVSYPKWPGKVIDDLEGQTSDGLNATVTYSVSTAAYEHIRDRNHVFSSTFAFSANDDTVNVGYNGQAESAVTVGVSGNFFVGLQVPALIGRTLLPEDDSASAAPAATVSYAFWRKHLDADPAIAGKIILVNATPVVVAGVAPPDFTGVNPGLHPDLWIPLSFYAAQMRRNHDYDLIQPKVWWLGVIGRRKPGVSAAEANTETQLLFRQQMVAQDRTIATDPTLPHAALVPADRGLYNQREELSGSLLLLMGMVAVVLLVACGNVAGLLLARATARQREIALRLSLGASPGRLLRQLLTESTALALLGGAAGLLVARWCAAGLATLLAQGHAASATPIHLDTRVLGFTAAISVVSGLLFGLLPALRATRVDVFPTLKLAARGTLGGQRFRAGKLLVASQVALCLALLIAAGLLVRTLRKLETVNLGFNRESMVTFRVQPGSNGYKGAALARYYEELRARIMSIPGVRAAGFSLQPTIGSGWSQGRADIPGYTEPGKRVRVFRHYVGPGYFEALGVPVAGRPITSEDVRGAPPVAVVNQALVRAYMRGDNPLGHTIDMGSRQHPNSGAMVGVARDVKYGDIRKDPPPTAYFPYQQAPFDPVQMTYAVRTSGDPHAVMSAIQSQALALDSTVPVRGLQTEDEVVDEALYLERTFALLSSCFGGLALLLACVGLYGTMAYTVSRRTGEIGIRMALGAMRGNIVAMVLREAAVVLTAGIAAGLPLAWFATKLLREQLFELSPHDPATLVASIGVLVAIGIVAGFVPARNASRVDPMVALRYE